MEPNVVIPIAIVAGLLNIILFFKISITLFWKEDAISLFIFSSISFIEFTYLTL